MKKADVLLSTSRAEGLPLFLSEAICLEKPIIATKTVGAEEVLQNGKYGRLVDITPIAIADAIQQFISNPQICSYYQNASIEGKQQYNPYVIMNYLHRIRHLLMSAWIFPKFILLLLHSIVNVG